MFRDSLNMGKTKEISLPVIFPFSFNDIFPVIRRLVGHYASLPNAIYHIRGLHISVIAVYVRVVKLNMVLLFQHAPYSFLRGQKFDEGVMLIEIYGCFFRIKRQASEIVRFRAKALMGLHKR